MNLWVNRVRQLAPLAVALFFFACEDETSFLGYKNPNQKFQSYSIEIPVESQVVLLDSVRSSNFMLANDVNRLLVGKYVDPVFGLVSSTAATEYYSTTVDKLPTDAVFVRAELKFYYDLYFHGSETPADQTFIVHKLNNTLDRSLRRQFITNTPVDLGEAIGSITVNVNPSLIREHYNPPPQIPKIEPTPDSLTFELNTAFGESLWAHAMNWSINTDSTFIKLGEFVKTSPGLAIAPDPSNTMMIGLRTGGGSELRLYYNTPTKTNQKLVFTMNNPVLSSYNNITTDRSSSPLTGIVPMQDFLPADNNRYIQAGTGIVTKINFDNFVKFADTVKGDIVISEAVLLIEGVQYDDNIELTPPNALGLRLINPDNTLRRFPALTGPQLEQIYANPQDKIDIAKYTGLIQNDFEYISVNTNRPSFFENDDAGYVANDNFGPLTINYSSANKAYGGNPTLFFQRLYKLRNSLVYKDFILYPLVSSSGPASLKSVNRVVFPSDRITLKIRYTQPTVNE